MTLTRLGPYEITGRIGAGGMGEVWRGRDSRIGRDVAIKILPQEFSSSVDRLRRFEQEARAAGGLNHPNLVTIHDLGTESGTPYIVMELLEGETLRDRIGSDGTARIPIRKAVDYSMQLASGLAAAHDRGIVHRDLKPENVFITPDGRVKILDFGLAKLTGGQAAGTTDDEATQQRDTSPGTVLGTAGYMSPEQVRGLDVDHRTDVFAFGAILYEMLTGQRAFRRGSAVETMNAILNEDPPEVTASAQQVPPAVGRIVRRCLEKSRTERFQSARDLAFALDAVTVSGPEKSIAAEAIVPAPRRRLLQRAGLVLIAAAVAGGAYYAGRRAVAPPPSAQFKALTFAAGSETSPAISPNGEYFAFVRDRDIWLQRTDARNAINLTRTPDVNEGAPAFSPDGRQIAFHTDGGIFVMGATGESVRRLTGMGFDPTWSPDGAQIAFVRDEPTIDPRSRNSRDNPLMVVSSTGGEPKLLLENDAMQPRWSPDGKRIAYWANDRAGQRDIFTVSAAGGKDSIVPVTRDMPLDWSPAWSPDGRWLYFSSDRGGAITLWRIAIDSGSGRTSGMPQLVSAPALAAGWIALSGDGRSLVFQATNRSTTVRTARFDGKTSTVVPVETPILDGALLIRGATPSRDGSLIAFTTDGREDVFVMRSDGSDIRQLTDDEARDRGAHFAPDGSITFYSSRSGNYQMWSVRPDGSELKQWSNVTDVHFPNYPVVSHDGRFIAASATDEGAWIAAAGRLPVTNVESLPRLPGGGAFWPQSWSRDDRRIAGTRWVGYSGIYIYSLDTKTYAKVSEDGRRAAWLDDRRLAVFEEGAVTLLDTVTGERRPLLTGDYSPIPSTCIFENCLLVSNRTESNIWMATLGEK